VVGRASADPGRAAGLARLDRHSANAATVARGRDRGKVAGKFAPSRGGFERTRADEARGPTAVENRRNQADFDYTSGTGAVGLEPTTFGFGDRCSAN
jgi:hypothetical protein